MAFIGDHDYAIDHFYYYKYAGIARANGSIPGVKPFPRNGRAFNGIDSRLWGTVDDFIPTGIYVNIESDNLDDYRARLAQWPHETVVLFHHSSIGAVISDCLDFSIMTITTVGYGNITPATWYAKRAAEVESLTGTVLLVVALGLVLSGNSKSEELVDVNLSLSRSTPSN